MIEARRWRPVDRQGPTRELNTPPEGVAAAFDQTRGLFEVRCIYNQPAGGLQVEVRRSATGAALAVAFPPGIRATAAPVGSGTRVSRALVLLRAPVVSLQPWQTSASIAIPVAWAGLAGVPPADQERLTLARCERGSTVERLLRVLCRGPRLPAEADAQLAVWIASSNIHPVSLVERGPRVSCTSRKLVLPLHGEGARRLLRAAGIVPRRLRFFRPDPLPELLPRAKKRFTS